MLKINTTEFGQLEEAMKAYTGDVEEAINEVLHEEAPPIIQDSIRRLMPRSDVKSWKGKKPHAKDSESLRNINGNLSVTITTQKNYQYLYFPNDGTNTRRHVGNQQFFEQGGEAVTADIVERCMRRLIN